MIQETKLLGCLAQFALAGTTQVTPTPSGGPVVSGSYIPDNAGVDSSTAALWVPLGIISGWEPKVSSSKVEIFGPSPGTLSLKDVRETKFKREISIMVTDCSNIMWLAAARALGITSPRTGAIGQYVPLTSGTIRGWIKAQQYNQDTNALENAEQVWGTMVVTQKKAGDDKNVEFDISFTQLWSALNSANGA